MQAALVEFIEDDQSDAFESVVFLQHAGEDAFGNDFDARRLTDDRFEAYAKADGCSRVFVQLIRQSPGYGACRKAVGVRAWAILRPSTGFVEQPERKHRALTRTRWRLQDSSVESRERVA